MSGYLETYSASIEEITIRMIAATILGFLVGLDRTFKQKPLGFRPFMIVSLGSCLFAIIILELVAGALSGQVADRVDVSRVMQGVIGGIGFLGAGAIMKADSNGRLRGSATGAGIWMVGGIGLAIGFGLYVPALLASVIAIAVFTIFGEVHNQVEEKAEELNGDS